VADVAVAPITTDPFIERDLARIGEFRTEYRSRFADKPYFGPAHAATIAAIGATALATYLAALRKPLKAAERSCRRRFSRAISSNGRCTTT